MAIQQVPNDIVVQSGTAAAPVVVTIPATNDTNAGELSVHGAKCGDMFVAKFSFRRRIKCECGKPVAIQLPDVFKFIHGCEELNYAFAANVATIEVTKVYAGESASATTPPAVPLNPATAAAIVWPVAVGEVYDVHGAFNAYDLATGC
jgi:hypothetical protein